jgi:A nuclease family of the HNH/ENDO VII superfamily with conserved AHH
MEITEATSALMSDTDDKDAYCGGKKVSESGDAVIDGVNGKAGNAQTLKTNMLKANIPAVKEPPKLAKGPNLFRCSKRTFPPQTHHLIPEKQLPTHTVTAWLTASPPAKVKHKIYVLDGDTKYDTNGAENGYFMPYASTTHQWESKSGAVTRAKVCFEMMRRTRIQLHQGPHSKTDYNEDIDDVETEGYKQQVIEFLDLIAERADQHVLQCDECKGKKKDGRILVQPLDALVRQVNLASSLLKALLEMPRIWVSRRAAGYYRRNHKGDMLVHPAKPFVTPKDF